MKQVFITIMAFSFAGLLVACTGKSQTKQAPSDNMQQFVDSGQICQQEVPLGEVGAESDLPWGDTDLAAIAFVGYYNDTEKALEMTRQRYGYDARWVEMEGDECYLIIPRVPEAIIEVRHYSYDVVNDTETVGEIIYDGNEAPILLRCNISDIHANAQVTITLNGKKTILVPKLDLRDGTINLPGVTPSGQGTVLDITQYEEGPNEPNEPIEQLINIP